LTLVLCLPTFKSEGEGKKYYAMGKGEWAQSDIVAVNTDLQRVGLQISVDCVQDIDMRYDTQYNDTLYYRIKTLNEETAESVTLYIYTNADYKENHNFSQSYETANVGAFTVQYTTVCTEDEGIYTITHTAQSEYKGVRIYLEYSQMSLSEQSDLLGFFARTFQVK
ncbi:MAG: hypothetical protein K2L51_01375, partial [Clostridiales bacterium]|nr:hypothetical protein [Clostridiales bacterium]